MINQEEYMRRVMKKTTRDILQSLLRTKEYSSKFLTRRDMKAIDDEIDKMSAEVIDKFTAALKARGVFGNGRVLGAGDFQKLFESTVKEYLKKHGTNKNRSK